MPELTVVAVLTSKPEAIETIQAGMSKLTAAARTEDGCISYDLHVDAANPARFVTVEKWASQEALDAHFGSPGMAEAMTSLTELAEAPLIITTTTLEI